MHSSDINTEMLGERIWVRRRTDMQHFCAILRESNSYLRAQQTSGFVRQSGAAEVDDMVEFVDKGELGDCVGDTKDSKGNCNEAHNILENIWGGGVTLVVFSTPLVRRFPDSPSASFQLRGLTPSY